MSNFENNKIFAAVLTAGITIMLTGFVADKIYPERDLEKDAVPIEGASNNAHGGSNVEKKPELPESIIAYLADADISKGAKLSKACAACHSFDKGGPTKMGPNLWNIVNREKGSMAGFSYSKGLKEKGGVWDYEALDQFLTKPRKYISDTKMGFAGMKKVKNRAAIIAWLREQADAPAALPTAEEMAKSKEASNASAHETAPKAQEAAPSISIEKMIASADPSKGAKVSKSCAACHSFDKGGPTKMGPNLWNIVNREKGSMAGFSYSKGLKEKGGVWDYEALDQFLTKPRKYISDTKMGFAGIKKEKTRAALIAWLREQSDDPAPLNGE